LNIQLFISLKEVVGHVKNIKAQEESTRMLFLDMDRAFDSVYGTMHSYINSFSGVAIFS
jgi:hypothetical protein